MALCTIAGGPSIVHFKFIEKANISSVIYAFTLGLKNYETQSSPEDCKAFYHNSLMNGMRF